jgi:hypothetical protein
MLDKEFALNKINPNLSSTLQTHPIFNKSISLIPCVKKDTSEVILFGNNNNSHLLNVEILYNKSELISFDIDSNSWRYISLGNLDNLLNLKFYYNNKMFIELDFENNIPKEEFRLKSVFEEINS